MSEINEKARPYVEPMREDGMVLNDIWSSYRVPILEGVRIVRETDIQTASTMKMIVSIYQTPTAGSR